MNLHIKCVFAHEKNIHVLLIELNPADVVIKSL